MVDIDIVALLAIDVQYDFLPNGSLAVPNSDAILPVIRRLMHGKWDWVIETQDFHPPGHVSFASTHSMQPFSSKEVEIPYIKDKKGNPATIKQMLWPDHCVQNTRGALIEESIREELNKWFARGRGIVVQKGNDKLVDAYSAFASSSSSSPPVDVVDAPLTKELQSRGINTIFAVGLATDYCVRMTALDAKKAGFNVYVIDEAVRAVGGEEARLEVFDEFRKAGIACVSVEDEVVKRYIYNV